jgi:cytochrome c biogenesis protein CcmG, thiol:disulfide interchange protein DsbE
MRSSLGKVAIAAFTSNRVSCILVANILGRLVNTMRNLWSLSRPAWNILMLFLFVGGSSFIWATRVQPITDSNQTGSLGENAALSVEPAPLVQHPAPDFTLTNLKGLPVQLSSLKGQVVLINVWATWCAPCRVEMPAIQTMYSQYGDQGFTVLAVNLQEAPEVVAQFMDSERLTFPALLDKDGQVSATYQARLLPSSFFVDRTGIVRAVYRGPMPRGIIAATVEQLLQEKP